MSLRPLSPELEEAARKELHEDPKRQPEDIRYIKEWLSKQPHLRTRTGNFKYQLRVNERINLCN